MKTKNTDSTANVSRFARDKRQRVNTTERVERNPRPRREGDSEGAKEFRPRVATKEKRSSYNPHFTAENRLRPEYEERKPRGERSFERAERGERSLNRTERTERGERNFNRTERSERTERSFSRGERTEHTEHTEEGGETTERTERRERGNRPPYRGRNNRNRGPRNENRRPKPEGNGCTES